MSVLLHMLFFHVCFCTYHLIYSAEESKDLAAAAQESKAEPVRTAMSLAKSARKTLHACKYPKQTEGSFGEMWAGE